MIKQKIRQLVLDRDKKCIECGSTEELTIDHIIPLSRGGISTPDNLRTLCGKCNRRKSSFVSWGWLERIMMALHIDEIIERLRNELKGQLSTVLAQSTLKIGEISGQIPSLQSQINKTANKNYELEKVIVNLNDKIFLLEKYLKIKVEEIPSSKEYKKIK